MVITMENQSIAITIGNLLEFTQRLLQFMQAFYYKITTRLLLHLQLHYYYAITLKQYHKTILLFQSTYRIVKQQLSLQLSQKCIYSLYKFKIHKLKYIQKSLKSFQIISSFFVIQ
ncbi:hypothetical protein TTHERM_000974051 (macronuclear) [Tetrahymena thermophila SB210]|uniref:Uncharacterized protein n=1 Tax=Tetrahymena thermophila (strain SB210) TaxID=312017 RepID=W7XE37_TETTS|nr:hypothetical protein TTHERM_000974051 [Tetrahymena thermophila SB210]EWS75917.1 hypothetical protein TTHERM_000974051 [Tetrahymena thermophila SB210]|eukprot:XP_012651542.1 hypothetical protein TTHERM_000974051 [Tetrahymena thermophila SB210]